MKKKNAGILLDVSGNSNHGYKYPNNNSDWIPPGKDGIKRKKPKDGLCERMFSTGNMVRPCRNQIYYQCAETGLYFCKQCAHDLSKMNCRGGIKYPINFIKA